MNDINVYVIKKALYQPSCDRKVFYDSQKSFY